MNLLFSFEIIEVPHQGTTLSKNGKKYLRLKKNTTACYDSKFSLYQKCKDGEHKKLRYKESLVI